MGKNLKGRECGKGAVEHTDPQKTLKIKEI
jgi:hypothetical protein